MDKNKIGFLSLYEIETSESYVVSLLVTDNNGIPIEFKCTHAVKPTAIQKTLYGEKLIPYIGITLCGIPLINSISNKPDIICVNLPYLLDIRVEIKTPTLLIRRAGEVINIGNDNKTDNEKYRIENEFGNFQSIVIQSHIENKEEAKTHMPLVNDLFNNFDLIEPFDRMRKSIDILGKSDNKFK